MRGTAYAPADLTDPQGINPGDQVEWTNADTLTTHTATEEHGLWDAEVAAGQKQFRVLEAGMHRYACRIHPQMRGSIAVTPFAYGEIRPERVRKRVRRKKRSGKRRYRYVWRTAFRPYVRTSWGSLDSPHAFDVERRRAGREWKRWRTATQTNEGAFRARSGQTWEIRVRLRARDDAGRATGWSPAAIAEVP